MNIFILSNDPVKNAQYHVDKHIVKMPLETAQMLCAVLHVKAAERNIKEGKLDIPYKLTHKNHPCTRWAAECTDNFRYLVELGKALCKEYTFRYGKVHKCQVVIQQCAILGVWLLPPLDFKRTPFAQAMPDEYKSSNAVTAYRRYYLGEKSHLFTWKNRPVPNFVKIHLSYLKTKHK